MCMSGEGGSSGVCVCGWVGVGAVPVRRRRQDWAIVTASRVTAVWANGTCGQDGVIWSSSFIIESNPTPGRARGWTLFIGPPDLCVLLVRLSNMCLTTP